MFTYYLNVPYPICTYIHVHTPSGDLSFKMSFRLYEFNHRNSRLGNYNL